MRLATVGSWTKTYLKVAGRWRYVYRAVDQYGQVVDVYVSSKHDIGAARRFFTTSLRAHGEPTEVITDLWVPNTALLR
jgi:IS6 family transposase